MQRLYVQIGQNDYNVQKKDINQLLHHIKSVPFVSKRGNMLANGIRHDNVDLKNVDGISKSSKLQKDHVDPGFIDFYD